VITVPVGPEVESKLIYAAASAGIVRKKKEDAKIEKQSKKVVIVLILNCRETQLKRK
jgi:hypothetical protein